MKDFKNMVLKGSAFLMLMVLPALGIAQDATDAPVIKVKSVEYVKGTFENALLINNQTVMNNNVKTLEFLIEHRFGVAKDSRDLFGVYAPANIRLGLTYGITKRISLGFGVTKNKMLYDLQAKVNICKQAKSGGCPVSVTYYGDVARSAQEDDNFLNQESKFKGTNKLSYFHELMIARKITDRLSLQLAGTYSHQNIIDSLYGQHDFYGASFVGRYRFSPQSSVLLEYDFMLNISGVAESVKPKPNIGLGYELSTGSHQFQVFVCTGQGIINQEYRVFNQNDIANWDVLIGFNITRLWDFR
ncbi:MAG: hypothetical protein IPP51_17830 [Bacteroidetes bacterium]|nr:hypothetical protein [Bacteroidota bacterium]